MISFSRRFALKTIGAYAAWLGLSPTLRGATVQAAEHSHSPLGTWHKLPDRVWLGEQFWANPMEDWRVSGGGAECLSTGGNRSVHVLTHRLENADGTLNLSVHIEELARGANPGGVGFRVGVRSDIDEYRSSCIATGGIDCGVVDGALQIGVRGKQTPLSPELREFTLRLEGAPLGDRYELTLTALDANGREMSTVRDKVERERVLGNIALASNFAREADEDGGSRFKFTDWTIAGDAVEIIPERKFGPILWSMYTLSDSRNEDGFVLKMSALTGPLGAKDDQFVELLIQRNGVWKSVGRSQLDPDSWTAIFRVPRWDATTATPYKLVYRQNYTDGTVETAEREGVIQANPVGRPLRLASLTCQNDYAFPYGPVVENLTKLDPDMLYFSGDQIYETHGGFWIVRAPTDQAILNYLRKFYEFGWAFGDLMRSRPTICLADDHDVFHGNLWGEGGIELIPGPMDATGGYEEPAQMVNVVHRTCAGHHPDYFDPTPCAQGISVYYGELVYGDVGFAIVADRQFKSGPGHVETGSGRADHVIDADIDMATLDKPGLELLGDRQEEFLRKWVDDWRGHRMKVLLSQTNFAAVATHHGRYDGFLRGDLDCGSWPATARNNAIRIVRKAMPLHINGDQHLTTLVQYGVDRQRDSCWSFCVPAIAVGYPRWWRADEMGVPFQHRPSHDLPNTGEYVDSFGNLIYVYAVGNPEVGTKQNRYELAHQKGSGFGMVTIDTEARTYKCEAFKFLVDATADDPANQFPGWPLTIRQHENQGENEIG